MKKAEITSQIFIYIMILVVGGGILLFGYKAISSFKQTADDTMMTKFTNDFKNDLKVLSYGRQRTITYYLPTSVKQLCFKGNDAVPADVQEEEIFQDHTYAAIRDAVAAGLGENVYPYPRGTPFSVGVKIDLDESSRQKAIENTLNFACFDVIGGSFKIVMNGQGSSVLLTESLAESE